eukprot:1157780-Pelagomonas_calceolata.AAC.8
MVMRNKALQVLATWQACCPRLPQIHLLPPHQPSPATSVTQVQRMRLRERLLPAVVVSVLLKGTPEALWCGSWGEKTHGHTAAGKGNNLGAKRAYKARFQEGVALFNAKPKKGEAGLQACYIPACGSQSHTGLDHATLPSSVSGSPVCCLPIAVLASSPLKHPGGDEEGVISRGQIACAAVHACLLEPEPFFEPASILCFGCKRIA